jgi:hypothetical protein
MHRIGYIYINVYCLEFWRIVYPLGKVIVAQAGMDRNLALALFYLYSVKPGRDVLFVMREKLIRFESTDVNSSFIVSFFVLILQST